MKSSGRWRRRWQQLQQQHPNFYLKKEWVREREEICGWKSRWKKEFANKSIPLHTIHTYYCAVNNSLISQKIIFFVARQQSFLKQRKKSFEADNFLNCFLLVCNMSQKKNLTPIEALHQQQYGLYRKVEWWNSLFMLFGLLCAMNSRKNHNFYHQAQNTDLQWD